MRRYMVLDRAQSISFLGFLHVQFLGFVHTACSACNGHKKSGFNHYLYHFGGSLLSLSYNGPQSPILTSKAPTLFKDFDGCT